MGSLDSQQQIYSSIYPCKDWSMSVITRRVDITRTCRGAHATEVRHTRQQSKTERATPADWTDKWKTPTIQVQFTEVSNCTNCPKCFSSQKKPKLPSLGNELFAGCGGALARSPRGIPLMHLPRGSRQKICNERLLAQQEIAQCTGHSHESCFCYQW